MPSHLSDQDHDAPVVVLTVADAALVLGQIIPDRVIIDAFPDAPPARDRRELLSDELHHRIQNTLAIVLSLARITARSCKTIEEFQEAFGDRVQAMAKTNALLLRGNEQAINVRSALELELAPYAGRGKVVLQCASLAISANSALGLSLLIHELATNAAKYGAFSSARGLLQVSWTLSDDRLSVIWDETEGPPVEQVGTPGFGTRLLKSALTPFDGKTEIAYLRTGVHCTMQCRMPAGEK